MSTQNAEPLSEEFKLMQRYDADWSGPKLIAQGAIWLAIALAVIYSLASYASPD
jgi:hypothetical protein